MVSILLETLSLHFISRLHPNAYHVLRYIPLVFKLTTLYTFINHNHAEKTQKCAQQCSIFPFYNVQKICQYHLKESKHTFLAFVRDTIGASTVSCHSNVGYTIKFVAIDNSG